MLDREQILSALQATPLAEVAESICQFLEPSIRVGVLAVQSDEIALGASRFGGLPDLPHSIAWPRGEKRPLALAAQLRLQDVAELDDSGQLPHSGWLYFFIDAADEAPFAELGERPSAWRVLYFRGDVGQLSRAELPEDFDERNFFSACALGFAKEWTLPSYGSTLLDGVGIPAEHRELYEDLVFSLHQPVPLPAGHALGPLRRLLAKFQHRWIGDPIHRILGHPEHFQVDPRLDWQRLANHLPLMTPADEKLRHAAQSWRLLLQLDAYEGGPNWLWGDSGTMYFGVPREDLAQLKFDSAQWTVECG